MRKRGPKRENLSGISTKIDAGVYQNLSAYCALKDLSLAEWVEAQARKLPKVYIEEQTEKEQTEKTAKK
jgi:hypothetical protein